MCFELDSEPPIPVIRGAAVARTRTSSSRPPTATAWPPSWRFPMRPAAVGIVVLPDVRGLYHFYEELALRFAERGMRRRRLRLLRPDGGGGEAGRRLPVHGARRADHAGGRAARRARGRRAASARARLPTSIFTVGFCFGGRTPGSPRPGGHGLAGAIGFYGMPLERNGNPGPADVAGRDGGADPRPPGGRRRRTSPPSTTTAFARALAAAGVEHELVVYEGAPHSFFDRRQGDFLDDSEDAWHRVLSFVETARRRARRTGRATGRLLEPEAA